MTDTDIDDRIDSDEVFDELGVDRDGPDPEPGGGPERPQDRLHALRGGDGPSVPSTAPDERWPDLADLSPYWESFQSFALRELGGQVQMNLRVEANGQYQFVAEHTPDYLRHDESRHRKRLVYDADEDTIRYEDTESGADWTLTDAFGGGGV